MEKKQTHLFNCNGEEVAVSFYRKKTNVEITVPVMRGLHTMRWENVVVNIDAICVDITYPHPHKEGNGRVTLEPFACRDGFIGRALRLAKGANTRRELVKTLSQCQKENRIHVLQIAEKEAGTRIHGKKPNRPRARHNIDQLLYERRMARSKPQPQIQLPWDNA